jgi:hypothetical protein
MTRVRRTAALILSSIVLSLVAPLAVHAADGPTPSEGCVPGTVWEDLGSGVKYLCIYDEAYGGTRWELLASASQRGAAGWLYRSSSLGCLYGQTGITALGGSGADALMRSYRWPCRTAADRTNQPVGELRSRVLIQVYTGSSWATCRDTGYRYSTLAASGWMASIDMGSVADCGSGSYRAWGYGGFLQGGAWRSGSQVTPSLYLR